MTKIAIAEAFSTGQFAKTYTHLAAQAEWIVVGEDTYSGKEAVIRQCEQTAGYFASVATAFKIINVISNGDHVAISGTAEFIRNGKRVSFVSACDMYEFDGMNRVTRITSYCIPEKGS